LISMSSEETTSYYESETKRSHLNNTPIIGIYSIPHDGKADVGFIPASYVKWIESAGGRVVPLPTNISDADAKKTLHSLNGLLFTGGSGAITDNARYLFKHALEFNKRGSYFPVWATCLGFEWVLEMVGKFTKDSLDQNLDAQDYSIPLTFTKYGRESSRLFADAPPKVLDALASENITYNHHQGGLQPDHFHQNEHLTKFFHLISTNVDRKGRGFVSMYEGRNFPVYDHNGIQRKMHTNLLTIPNIIFLTLNMLVWWPNILLISSLMNVGNLLTNSQARNKNTVL